MQFFITIQNTRSKRPRCSNTMPNSEMTVWKNIYSPQAPISDFSLPRNSSRTMNWYIDGGNATAMPYTMTYMEIENMWGFWMMKTNDFADEWTSGLFPNTLCLEAFWFWVVMSSSPERTRKWLIWCNDDDIGYPVKSTRSFVYPISSVVVIWAS